MPTGTLNLPSLIPKDPYQTRDATAQQSTATGYDPSAFTVNRPQTVAGQLEDLIDQNSPYIQQAERRAASAMNDRGLLNSSIAIGAGRTAAIESALPIATADAGTFNQAMINTINAQNAAKNFRAGAENTASLANAQLGTQANLANAEMTNKARSEAYGAGTQLQLAGVDAATRLGLAQLDTDTRMALGQLDANTRMALGQLDATTKVQLANIDGQYRQLLQSNQSASSMFNQVVQNIAAISQSQTLDQAGKDNAIQSQINMLNEALQTVGGISATDAAALDTLNLGQYFSSATVGTGGATGETGGAGTSNTLVSSIDKFDWQRYLAENPGVAQAQTFGSPTYYPESTQMSPQDWAWFHYVNYGKPEGRLAYNR